MGDKGQRRSSRGPGQFSAQRQFGRQASYYATSVAHRTGESLAVVREYAALGCYRYAVDIGTGAGFTAFEVAPYARQVLATDVTPEMLAQTRRLAAERGLDNVGVALVVAEALPFAAGSLDCVTTRAAAHHFHDLSAALDEVARVLAPGGVFILSDTVAPEDPAAAAWQHDVERRRDASHMRDLPPSEWLRGIRARGMKVIHSALTRVHLEFNDWTQRSWMPAGKVERLRRDFLAAPGCVVAAFGIEPRDDGAIDFSWDCLVVRAVKGR